MIRVRNLSFTHPGNIPALRHINLDIIPGERLALIGANGSGKTTLARCFNGLESPQSGRIDVDDLAAYPPGDLFEIRKRIGMVFQNPDDQLVSTTVESELAFGLENLAIAPEEMHFRVEEALSQFHLEIYRHHPPNRLSGGEKQRLAIAAAMILRPRYLILDEPTALLDPQGRAEILALLDDLKDRFGTTTIHITQLPAEAVQADRIIVLHQGCVIYDAAPTVVFQNGAKLREIGLEVPFPQSVLTPLKNFKDIALDSDPPIEILAEALAPGLATTTRESNPSNPPPSLPAKLSTQALEHIYDQGLPSQRTGLDKISVEIPRGGIVALVGPSGSGKTTLAQHLNALLKPHRGRILLDGQDIWKAGIEMSNIRRRVGLVFQFPELQLFEETVDLDVAFGPKNLGFSAARIDEQVSKALTAVALPQKDFGHRSPLALSGGEKRRVALAGILAMDPEVLVLDEPTAGLDPGASRNLRVVFQQLNQRGTTLVLITHDMDLVAHLATHIVVLSAGRLVLQGPARAVLSNPNFPQVGGLEPPPPVQLMHALATRGCAVPTDLITQDEVTDFLATFYKPPEGDL